MLFVFDMFCFASLVCLLCLVLLVSFVLLSDLTFCLVLLFVFSFDYLWVWLVFCEFWFVGVLG